MDMGGVKHTKSCARYGDLLLQGMKQEEAHPHYQSLSNQGIYFDTILHWSMMRIRRNLQNATYGEGGVVPLSLSEPEWLERTPPHDLTLKYIDDSKVKKKTITHADTGKVPSTAWSQEDLFLCVSTLHNTITHSYKKRNRYDIQRSDGKHVLPLRELANNVSTLLRLYTKPWWQ